MKEKKEYFARFATEEIYLWEDESQVYVRSIPVEGGYRIKYPGDRREYPTEHPSDIVTSAIHGAHEVTREQYLEGKMIIIPFCS